LEQFGSPKSLPQFFDDLVIFCERFLLFGGVGHISSDDRNNGQVDLDLRRALAGRRSLFYRKERAELERIRAPVSGRHRACCGGLALVAGGSGQSGKLNEGDLQNEVVILVLIRHETTAIALTWAWYLIASHPEIEGRRHAEVGTVLDDRLPAMQDVPRLRYTLSCVCRGIAVISAGACI
jgi:cytochrome P450